MFPLGGIRGNANRTSYIFAKPHVKRLNLCAEYVFLELRMGKSRMTTVNTHKPKFPWHHGWGAHQVEFPPGYDDTMMLTVSWPKLLRQRPTAGPTA